MAGAVIAVQDLRKAYGPVQAVDGISFSVAEGEVFGFVGPNGAGKTTSASRACAALTGEPSGSWTSTRTRSLTACGRWWPTQATPNTRQRGGLPDDRLPCPSRHAAPPLVTAGRLGFSMRFEGVWWSVAAGFLLSAGAFLALGYLLASLAATSRTAMIVGMTLLHGRVSRRRRMRGFPVV